MPRPSQLQLEHLVIFLEHNPEIATNPMRCAEGRSQTNEKWAKQAVLLNSLGGAHKDAKAWMKYWTAKKYNLRRRVTKRYISEYRRERGQEVLPPLSNLDKRLLSILGGNNFILGIEQVTPLSLAPEPEPQSMETNVDSPTTVMSTGCQATPTDSQMPRRRRRQTNVEWQQFMRIEEKRAEAEAANANGWQSVAMAINNLANAIIMCGETVAEALKKPV